MLLNRSSSSLRASFPLAVRMREQKGFNLATQKAMSLYHRLRGLRLMNHSEEGPAAFKPDW